MTASPPVRPIRDQTLAELAHSVHLEEAHGFWRVGRDVLGRAPYLFPNTLSMSWLIEGLATFEETEGTAFGRGRNPDSRMVLRMATLDDQLPIDRAVRGLDRWPGGAAPYLFGESFLRDLDGRFGPETVPELTRVPHSASVMSSTRRTLTPAKYISISASSTELSRRRYRSTIAVSKGTERSFGIFSVTSPALVWKDRW